MSLGQTLYQMMQDNQSAGQPTDLKTGTVTAVSPLEITINTQMAPLRESVLILTQSVVEKKIPILKHRHQINVLGHSHTTASEGQTADSLTGSYATLYAEDNIVCYEHGKALPVEDGYIILNRALAVGDKVILLRVQNGQKYIVLSRAFEFGG